MLTSRMNGGYGALANQYFRWFKLDFAEAITMSGQATIIWAGDKTNILVNKFAKTANVDYIIYTDTDSIFLDLSVFMQQKPGGYNNLEWATEVCKEVVSPSIARNYTKFNQMLNTFDQDRLYAKLEKLSSRGIWTGKKKYALNVLSKEGVVYDTPEIMITGIEAIRSSTPAVVKVEIKSAISTIMNGTEQDLRNGIENFRERFSEMGFDQIAFPRGVSDMDKWIDVKSGYKKGTPIHTRGAITYNNTLKKLKLDNRYERINNGSKVKFIYLMVPNPIQSNVIAAHDRLPAEFNLDKYIDYATQFEKTYLAPVRNITDHIGWQVESKATLEDFWA